LDLASTGRIELVPVLTDTPVGDPASLPSSAVLSGIFRPPRAA
jgi:hypothetical protein